MAYITLIADAFANGMRLDKYVSSVPNGIGRSRLKNGIISIKVNNNPKKLSYIVKEGDSIDLEWEDPLPTEVIPEDIPLDVLFENENVSLINKKQGMVTHPAAGNWKGTLVHALLYHWQKESSQIMRSGIVHRLDKDTSGVIITARNIESEEWLQRQFYNRRVKKVYAAILCGVPKERHGVLKMRIIRDPRNRKRFTCTDNPQRGKSAHTIYKCIATYGNYSLVILKPKTGRTHQLRVHMKHLGCPILGDPIYGKKDELFDTATLMLHAKTLGIRLPFSDEFNVFEAPIPLRFKKVMKKLHETWQRNK